MSLSLSFSSGIEASALKDYHGVKFSAPLLSTYCMSGTMVGLGSSGGWKMNRVPDGAACRWTGMHGAEGSAPRQEGGGLLEGLEESQRGCRSKCQKLEIPTVGFSLIGRGGVCF